jgi:TPR repeat protein
MYNYANLLATGRGVRADAARAFAWYLRAAEQGHAKSMNLVGRCYEEGLGVEIDIAVAHGWYRKSADAGDFRGQRSLAAVLLESGRAEEANYWIRRAIEAKAAANR